MIAIPTKIVRDAQGAPLEVVLPWATFCEIVETMGYDLDAEAEMDLREARRDIDAGHGDAFVPLASL